MSLTEAIPGIVAFVVTAGFAGLIWFRRGRDPEYGDDDSVLLPAPPPAMTAATAAIVSGAGSRTAFIAALLDLASRDEIAFESEGRDGRGSRLGITFRGGDSTDPRVLLNRRNPIGEAESWLLGQLHLYAAASSRPAGSHDDLPPEAAAAGAQMLMTMWRMQAATAAGDDNLAARAAREHGLGSLGMDAASMEAAYEAKTGHPMPDDARRRLEAMTGAMATIAGAGTTDADRRQAMATLNATFGEHATAQPAAAQPPVVAAPAQPPTAPAPAAPAPAAISAASARMMGTPFLFGTFIETYAKRHGWVPKLAVLTRLPWYGLAGVELIVGIVVAAAGGTAGQAQQALGSGIALGGLATYLIGQRMPALTMDGAVMKAQLAAYRRTLAMTFGSAASLAGVVATRRMPWLDTPDQTIVWGIALGLRRELESLLARTSSTPDAAGSKSLLGDANPADMLAGIEAIGSESTSQHHPA
jgi:hypothetical protein